MEDNRLGSYIIYFLSIIIHDIELDKANWRGATRWHWNRKKRRPRTEFSIYSPWDPRFKNGRIIQMRVPTLTRKNLPTKIVLQLEKSWVIETYNFAWGKLDSIRKQFCFGSKVFELSVQMANFQELICTVKTCFFKSDWKKVNCFQSSELFTKIFPSGNAESFCDHIFRIFDSDGNNFLDFKEFLMVLDIAQCTDERQKLEWSFR